MQEVESSLHNISPLFDEIEQLYTFTSVQQHKNRLVPKILPDVFMSIIMLFKEYGHTNYDVRYKSVKYELLDTSEAHKNTILVCYSGGKDSTATALYYKDLGYDVYLYHLKGINKTYVDEWKNVKEVAEALDIQYVIEEVKLKGTQEWTEHPLKNWIIANKAIQFAIKHKLPTNIAFGNFSTSTLNKDPFSVCGGDCRELWEAYNKIIQHIIPDFEVQTPLENMQQTLDILMEHKDIAVMCQSCIGPYRYRKYLHKKNAEHYGIQVPENRCGSCWKCCLEYIVYCDNDIYEYNEEYYKHCISILRHNLKYEQGISVRKCDVWEYFIFYDRSKSKYYGKRR